MSAALTIRPIGMPELWVFLAAKKAPVSAGNYRDLAREVSAARVVGAFSSDQHLVGIGAVTPVAGAAAPIAWLAVTGDGFGRFGVSAVKAIRAELAKAGSAIALVEETNENGKRLARLVGLEATEAVHLGMRVWRVVDFRKLGKAASGHGSGSAAPPG